MCREGLVEDIPAGGLSNKPTLAAHRDQNNSLTEGDEYERQRELHWVYSSRWSRRRGAVVVVGQFVVVFCCCQNRRKILLKIIIMKRFLLSEYKRRAQGGGIKTYLILLSEGCAHHACSAR